MCDIILFVQQSGENERNNWIGWPDESLVKICCCCCCCSCFFALHYHKKYTTHASWIAQKPITTWNNDTVSHSRKTTSYKWQTHNDWFQWLMFHYRLFSETLVLGFCSGRLVLKEGLYKCAAVVSVRWWTDDTLVSAKTKVYTAFFLHVETEMKLDGGETSWKITYGSGPPLF